MLKRCTLILLFFEILQVSNNAQSSSQDSSLNRSVLGYECSSTLKIKTFFTPIIPIPVSPPPPPGTPPPIAPPLSHPFKVVIGEPINYKATGASVLSWNWQLGDGPCTTFTPFWTGIMPTTPTSFASTGQATIPSSSLPEFNSMLGSVHGALKVFAGSEPPVCSNIDQTVKVFFKKDDPAPVAFAPSGIGMPNWYYYWSQNVPITFRQIPGIKLFNTTPGVCGFVPGSMLTLELDYVGSLIGYGYSPTGTNTYGANRYIASEGFVKNPVDFGCSGPSTDVLMYYDPGSVFVFHKIRIGEGCGFRKNDPRGPVGTDIHGLHVFLSTILHEKEHAVIECESWANGYRADKDTDSDGYNDDWEVMIATTPGSIYPFVKGIADTYDPNYSYGPSGCKTLSGGPCSVGTRYEEDRCRGVESTFLNSLSTTNPYDAWDWSFDPSNINQGKNWK